jgi:AhpD family alkylhydroperoxidase
MADFYGKETSKYLRNLRQNAPDAFKGFLEFDKEVFKDGAIPSKTKELMAITAAHVTQCPWCIEAHVRDARTRKSRRRYGLRRRCARARRSVMARSRWRWRVSTSTSKRGAHWAA